LAEEGSVGRSIYRVSTEGKSKIKETEGKYWERRRVGIGYRNICEFAERNASDIPEFLLHLVGDASETAE
jgi:hypothetical protein